MAADSVTVRESVAVVNVAQSLNSARARVSQALDFTLATGTTKAIVAAFFIWLAMRLLDLETWALSARMQPNAPSFRRLREILFNPARRRVRIGRFGGAL